MIRLETSLIHHLHYLRVEVRVDEVDVVGQPAHREYQGHRTEHLHNLNSSKNNLNRKIHYVV